MATGRLDGLDVVVAAMEYAFIGGSLGVVAGEKITRGLELALAPSARHHRVLFRWCAHDGRRAVVDADGQGLGRSARLDRAKVPFVSVLTDPTTGGVTASFAMLGDLNIAEPGRRLSASPARASSSRRSDKRCRAGLTA